MLDGVVGLIIASDLDRLFDELLRDESFRDMLLRGVIDLVLLLAGMARVG